MCLLLHVPRVLMLQGRCAGRRSDTTALCPTKRSSGHAWAYPREAQTAGAAVQLFSSTKQVEVGNGNGIWPGDSTRTGFQLAPELEPLSSEAIFGKITMSAFEGTPLDPRDPRPADVAWHAAGFSAYLRNVCRALCRSCA